MLMIFLLQFAIVFSSFWPPLFSTVPAPQSGSGFKVREPNLYAPDLYADNLDFIATLLDMPALTKGQSYWELSYQIIFIPEDKYWETIRTFPRGGYNPKPEEFPGRILLAQGHKKMAHLDALNGRTLTLNGVRFKQRIPDAQRTKFGMLGTAYSVKIFDAELNTTVYHSGLFLTEAYEDDPQDEKQAIARKTLYLNFGVNKDGSLNYSQMRRKSGARTWR